MENKTSLGHNRTGIQTSPIDTAKLTEVAGQVPADPASGLAGLAAARMPYIEEAEGVGTMPPPATMKGMLKTAADALTGDRAHVLLDKMGERLAFERGGVRLYEGLLIKAQATTGVLPEGALQRLQHFRDEEAQHFALVRDCIAQMGGDPTAQTPCADLVGVEAMGLMQAMSDPRTNLLQSLHVILDAELLDNAGWELLIGLARHMGHDDMADRFAQALQQENEHLVFVRQCVEQLTLADAGAMASIKHH